MDIEEPCIADGCRKAAERGRKYCHGHRKREKQRRAIDTPLREWGAAPDDYLERKALEFANAKEDTSGNDRALRLARKLLRYAAKAYARKRQKVPRTPDDTSRG